MSSQALALYYGVVKRNLLLIGIVILILLIIVNSTKRISSLRDTSKKVDKVEEQLQVLRQENEKLKVELEYKKSDEFKEAEIRNKLGMVKQGEAVVVLPQKDDEGLTTNDERQNIPNYIKWWNLFFRT